MTGNPPDRAATRLPGALLAVALLWPLAGCNSAPPRHPGEHESLNATLWSLTAPEFYANATQAYRTASRNLDTALGDPAWTAALEQQGDYADLAPAVLLDIDQTVLDNSVYNARIVTQYGEYTQETFSQWCQEERSLRLALAWGFVVFLRPHAVMM